SSFIQVLRLNKTDQTLIIITCYLHICSVVGYIVHRTKYSNVIVKGQASYKTTPFQLIYSRMIKKRKICEVHRSNWQPSKPNIASAIQKCSEAWLRTKSIS